VKNNEEIKYKVIPAKDDNNLIVIVGSLGLGIVFALIIIIINVIRQT